MFQRGPSYLGLVGREGESLERGDDGGDDGREVGIVGRGAGDEGRAERREAENEWQPRGKSDAISHLAAARNATISPLRYPID